MLTGPKMPEILAVQKSTLCRFSGRLIFSEVSAWHPLHLLAMVSHGSQLVTARCSVLVGLQLIPQGEHPPSFLPRAAPGRELIGLILFGSRLQTKATRIFLETDLREFRRDVSAQRAAGVRLSGRCRSR